MARHPTREELEAGLAEVLAAPKDHGAIKAILVRPVSEERQDVSSCDVSLAGGVAGDHWASGCWKTTDDGKPHPDVQICIMNSRCIEMIAGSRENWPPAGDNLFVDMDLSPENLAPGTQVRAGNAVLEITDTPHNACAKFIDRYGRDAAVFVNTGAGRDNRLRGIYARVVKDGTINVGDTFDKI